MPLLVCISGRHLKVSIFKEINIFSSTGDIVHLQNQERIPQVWQCG